MNIEEFVKKVCNEMVQHFGNEVRIKEVQKLNGVKFYGLIIPTPESNVAPTIYLESFYDRYSNTGNWDETFAMILKTYTDNCVKQHFDTDWFHDFQEVQKHIFYKLINFEANKKLLEEIPYTRYLDFAIVYYVHYDSPEIGPGDILIHNNHLEIWKCTAQALHLIAKENTPKLFPPEAINMAEMFAPNLHMSQSDPDNADDETEKENEDFKIPMILLTNKSKVNGAITILYGDLLQKFAETANTDIVILPSSIHEVILLPFQDEAQILELKEKVYTENHTKVPSDIFLSDNVYLYRRGTNEIQIAGQAV